MFKSKSGQTSSRKNLIPNELKWAKQRREKQFSSTWKCLILLFLAASEKIFILSDILFTSLLHESCRHFIVCLDALLQQVVRQVWVQNDGPGERLCLEMSKPATQGDAFSWHFLHQDSYSWRFPSPICLRGTGGLSWAVEFLPAECLLSLWWFQWSPWLVSNQLRNTKCFKEEFKTLLEFKTL